MCIIIDPPLFIPMFKSADARNASYLPVRAWIDGGSGRFVIGGTKYLQEMDKIRSVISIILEYERKGKVLRRISAAVDVEVANVRAIEPAHDFDDPHLVALVRECGCKLICVDDPRSHKYLRSSHLYNSPKDRPKLYTSPANANLLCTKNVPKRFR